MEVKKDNLKIGDLVIVKDENISPSKWPLARISEVHPSIDGSVRVVNIIMAGRKRTTTAIHKLVPFPINNEDISLNQSYNKIINSNLRTVKEKNKPKNSVKKENISKSVWVMLALLMIPSITATYTISYPKPGIFIEHIGYGKIGRGYFKIEVNVTKASIEDNIHAINNTVLQMHTFCKKANSLVSDTQCTKLIHHLEELEKQAL